MLERNEYMIKGSLTDKILSLTNRLHEAKNTKTLEKGEFSELLDTVSEYICRGIKNNKHIFHKSDQHSYSYSQE